MPPVSFQGKGKNPNSVPHLFPLVVNSVKTLGLLAGAKNLTEHSVVSSTVSVSGDPVLECCVMEYGFHAGRMAGRPPGRNGHMLLWKYFVLLNIFVVFKGGLETLCEVQIPEDFSCSTFQKS